MSALHVGSRCHSCALVDFLPTACPSCSYIFCANHIHNHTPCSSAQTTSTNPIAGPSTFRPRAKCWLEGCDRISIEGRGGIEDVERAAKAGSLAKEVRCEGCGGSYCVSHREQLDHGCTAPLLHNARTEAVNARKSKAQEIIAKNFPNQAGKVLPKIPPPKDTMNNPPSRSPANPTQPTNLQPSNAIQTKKEEEKSQVGPDVKKAKTKEEKLRDMHHMRIRSTAVPLDPSARLEIGGKRRFFEYKIGTMKDVEGWESCKGWTAETKRVWVPIEMPMGKVMDSIINSNKISRPPADGEKILALVHLHSSGFPKTKLQAHKLVLSQSAGDAIEEGCCIALIKDWRDPT